MPTPPRPPKRTVRCPECGAERTTKATRNTLLSCSGCGIKYPAPAPPPTTAAPAGDTGPAPSPSDTAPGDGAGSVRVAKRATVTQRARPREHGAAGDGGGLLHRRRRRPLPTRARPPTTGVLLPRRRGRRPNPNRPGTSTPRPSAPSAPAVVVAVPAMGSWCAVAAADPRVVDLSVGEPDAPEVAAGAAADPDAPAAGGPMLDPGLPPAPPVEEPTVRGLLLSLGAVAHVGFADDDVPDHWQFTPAELDQLTPPLTRWINRQPRLRRAIEHGDELAVAVALSGYVGRNVAAGQAARRNREDHDPDGNVTREDRPATRPAGAPAGPAAPGPHGRRPDAGTDGRGVRAPTNRDPRR